MITQYPILQNILLTLFFFLPFSVQIFEAIVVAASLNQDIPGRPFKTMSFQWRKDYYTTLNFWNDFYMTKAINFVLRLATFPQIKLGTWNVYAANTAAGYVKWKKEMLSVARSQRSYLI